ncbi:MAG: BON domain-containing protein [Pseudomonadales bacterium]
MRFGKTLKIIIIGYALFIISGCSSVIDATTSEPIEENKTSRSMGEQIDDEVIETKALVNIAKADPGLEDAHIIVVSVHGMVLLAGQVPDEGLRQVAEAEIKKLRDVRSIHNQLTVGEPSSGSVRASDTWITTKLKSKMAFNGEVSTFKTKVVTENGVVYLMGLSNQEHAANAAVVARETRGVQKVVKIFEYVD